MKKIILFLYVLTNTLFAQTFDFFPLEIGTKYTYSYYNYDEEWHHPLFDSGYTWFEKDSGLVYYTIIDSIQIDDSLIIWTIEQRDSLLHKYYYSGWDTTYWRLNTSQHQLTENLTNMHKLLAQMNIWVLNSNIFRFANDTSEIIEYTFYEDFNPGTIKLQKGVGLISVYKYFWRSGITNGELHLKEAILVNRTLSFILPDQTKKGYDFDLIQNYPNPFNPVTFINYTLRAFGFVTLKVYDVLGKEITTLVNEEKPSGDYEVSFNASNLASGIYYYQLRAGDFVETKKMILLK